MTAKREEKEVQRIAVLFEEECKWGASFTAVKLETFIDQWFEEYANIKLKEQTLRGYKSIRQRINSELGHLRLDKVTTRDVQRFIGKLAATERENRKGVTLSAKTVKNSVSLISSVYEYAVRMHLIMKNPCTGVTLPRYERPEVEMPSLADTRILLDVLSQEIGNGEPLAVFLTLAVYTGLRRGELLGLEWRDIDFEHRLVSVRRAAYYTKLRGAYTDTLKTKSSFRTLRLSAAAIKWLEQYRDWQRGYAASLGDKWRDSGRVFTNWCGEAMYINAPERYLKQICRTHGLPIVTLHSLRHLNASLLISAGLDVKTVQASLGHSSASTTLDIYAHEFAVSQALASDAIANALERTLAR
jgi:integrase